MKKYVLFAAACVALVACNKNENAINQEEPGQTITLHANVDFATPNSSAARMMKPVDLTQETISFVWEAGDQITISNGSESSTLTIVDKSINGGQADFTGEALSDMSSYTVLYGDTSQVTVTYVENSFKPFASGTGAGDSFTLSTLYPVVLFSIKGREDITLDRIEAYYWDEIAEDGGIVNILPFGTNGLPLSSSVKHVYFPICHDFNDGILILDQNENDIFNGYNEPISVSEDAGKIFKLGYLDGSVGKEYTINADLTLTPAKFKSIVASSNMEQAAKDAGFAYKMYSEDFGNDGFYTDPVAFGAVSPSWINNFMERIIISTDEMMYTTSVPMNLIKTIFTNLGDDLGGESISVGDEIYTFSSSLSLVFDDYHPTSWADYKSKYLSESSTLKRTELYWNYSDSHIRMTLKFQGEGEWLSPVIELAWGK